MEEINPDNAHYYEHPEIVPRGLRVVYRPENDERQQTKRGDNADETQLLAHYRKDKIGMAGWQEFQLVFRSVKHTFAEKADLNDFNFRLSNMIFLANRISLGIQKSQNTFLLVWLQNKPRNRKDQDKR